MPLKIAVLQTLGPELEGRVRALVPQGFGLALTRSTQHDDLVAVLRDADYAVTFGIAVTEELIAAAPKLRLLHRWGTGVDGLPFEACRRRGILVARTAGSNARPVAEYVVGAMIASSRMLTRAHQSMHEGKWLKKELWMRNLMLAGRTIGLVGLGAIGQQVARRLRPFECEVLYTKRNRLSEEAEQELGVRFASLGEVLGADIVSLHCPLDETTRHMITARELASMKPHAILINTARGGLIREHDLAEALRRGTIRSAVLDVFEQEPVSPDSPLFHLDNAILTPHIAANVADNVDNDILHFMDNIRLHSEGKDIRPGDRVV